MKVDLLFLGSGGFFSKKLGHSNMLLKMPNNNMLIDCGSQIPDLLDKNQINPSNIDSVYISHLHGDHAGGLEWLAFTRYFSVHGKPKLFIHESLWPSIWAFLAPSLGAMKFHDSFIPMGLDDYFEVFLVDSHFEYGGLKFKTVRNSHLPVSYGLTIGDNSQSVYISTDSYISEQELLMWRPWWDMPYIFHDCELLPKPSGVHSHFNVLDRLPPKTKRNMWLYHWNENCEVPDHKLHGFAGFVSPSQNFSLDL